MQCRPNCWASAHSRLDSAVGGRNAHPLTVLAMVGSGVGHGFIFVGDMSEISMATPAEERGAVIGTFYLVNYIGLGSPVIGVGMLLLSYGLLAATRVVAAVIVALCVLLIPLVVGAANASHGAAADG